MKVARAVWFERRGIAALRHEPLAPLSAGEVLVGTSFSGISAGTERIVLAGEVPAEVRTAMALETMRGDFDLPISYGYAAVGVVEEAAPDVRAPRPGERVFALHPHHDRFVIRADRVRPLPQGPPAERLVLAANLETAVNVVWDAEIALGDRVAIVGLGVVGLLAVHLAAKSGASVVAIDPDAERRSIAGDLGAATVKADIRALGSADAIVECSGNPEALAAAIAHAGAEARVVIGSWYGAKPVLLPLGGTFHPHRIRLQSSQVGAIPAHRRRWSTERRWSLVCDLLSDPLLDRLLAAPVPLGEAPAVYAELAAGIRWNPPQRIFDGAR